MSQLVKKIRTSAGDCQIDYNALANLPTLSNPNLLINSDFRNPVNQRGLTTYTGGTQKCYTIDRWCTGEQDYSRTVDVVDGGITITNPNTTHIGTLQQIFEHTLPQGDYTLTLKVKEMTGSAGTMSCGGSASGTKKQISVGVNTMTLTSATVSSFIIYLAPSSSITLEWAKLECGTTATPFVPRIYAEEVAMCQRYYVQLKTIYPLMIAQRNNAGTSAYMFVPLPVALRNAPSITFVNAKTMKNGLGGSFYDLTDVTCVGVCNSGVTLQVTAAENFEAGVPYFLILPESGYIKFDAEVY